MVDDEPEITQVLRAYLEAEGFRVVIAGDGLEALGLARSRGVDLVLLDLLLPGLDGREVCRRLRNESDLPIIMLTARGDEVDRVVGLELGADDYITKPFSPREVVARVRAVLRRAHARSQGGAAPAPGAGAAPVARGAEDEVHRVGELTVDVPRHQATLRGRELELTPTEFKILATLASHPGRVFTRLQLVERVQGMAFEGYERTIDAHIKNLRQKLGDDPRHPRFIATVYGVGYKLVPQESPPSGGRGE
ncbi:response regulator transcription factor [Carboxydochorda subterranea]|uniref:Response regulator transcription factor n=1 Tax=Carboxydichorda subterranea TaxID=3109565 RepID=A0ABZ1BW23_9FIRM|nr:response regulator transcription factor [Limnochorda sp. L945t]WRP16991.1 response regulator transcription factor [Limnochorda sp. L945t]